MDPTAAGVRTLVAWCPDWPLVAAGIPPTIPAAVFRANRVVACTATARVEGVKRGLRRREAQGRCPELVVEHHDPSREARMFEPVVAIVGTFTPRVEVIRPGTCALPVRGPSRYFGGDEALADRIREAVDAVLSRLLGGSGEGPCSMAEVGCRTGVADGPFAAVQAARRGLVVPVGGSADFLAPLPITLLEEAELTDLLLRLGLRTLGAFASLPAANVVGRFGPVGAIAHHRAAGMDERLLDGREPPADLSVEVRLEPPADRVDTAAFAAKSMADELCGSLGGAGLICTCIRIEAETEHGEDLSRVWRHHRSFTPATVAERVRWQLDGWLADRARCGCPLPDPLGSGSDHEPVRCPGGTACPNPVGGTTGGLTLLRLVPETVQADEGRQPGFWGGATEADDRAARGLARVQGLLGPDAVMTAVLGGGRGPAEQVRLVPWGAPREPARPGDPAPSAARRRGPSPRGSTPEASPPAKAARPGTRVRSSGRSPSAREIPVWPGRIPLPSPAIVPPAPIRADLVDASGVPVGVTSRSFPTRPPHRLSVSGGPWEEIIAWAGPWTADERWWDPGTHRRLARAQVVTGGGGAYLMLLEQGRWWVEAVYD